MITAQERQDAFMAALKKLLEEHGAEIEVTLEISGWDSYEPVVDVFMESKWVDGELVADSSGFSLPQYLP